MTPPSIFEIAARRHRMTGQDYLTSLVESPENGWEIITSKLDGNNLLEIEDRIIGTGPHPVISRTIIALQTRYDDLGARTVGKAAEESTLAARHLSCLLHVGSHRILNCGADEALAEKIAMEIADSCERVRTRLSLTSELVRIAQSIEKLGCGRILRVA